MTKKASWTRRILSPVIRRGGRLARNEDGAVLVEFALLAVPFFALVFAILETSLAFFAQQVLESALQDATRGIRTGQSQTSWDAVEFRRQICKRSYGLLDCSESNPQTDRLIIKVEPVNSFDTAISQIGLPVDPACSEPGASEDECAWTLSESFNDGQGNDVIVAQAFYKWPTVLNLPWFTLANQAGNNRLLSAARVFKNEPF